MVMYVKYKRDVLDTALVLVTSCMVIAYGYFMPLASLQGIAAVKFHYGR